MRASAPGRSSSLTVNQTVTRAPPVAADGTRRPVDRPLRCASCAPSPAAPRVQIFGLENDQATRAAVRFFKERRVEIHHVDLPPQADRAGELRRFVERLGAAALLDTEGRTYRDAGLGYLTDGRRARSSSGCSPTTALLRLPLVRFGNDVTRRPGRGERGSRGSAAERAARPTR